MKKYLMIYRNPATKVLDEIKDGNETIKLIPNNYCCLYTSERPVLVDGLFVGGPLSREDNNRVAELLGVEPIEENNNSYFYTIRYKLNTISDLKKLLESEYYYRDFEGSEIFECNSEFEPVWDKERKQPKIKINKEKPKQKTKRKLSNLLWIMVILILSPLTPILCTGIGICELIMWIKGDDSFLL